MPAKLKQYAPVLIGLVRSKRNSFVTVPLDSELTCNGQTIDISITILSCAMSFQRCAAKAGEAGTER